MSLFPTHLIDMARRLAADCMEQRATIATAESCTGGLLSALLTELPGSSRYFTHGFVTYANAAKTSMLHVPSALIAEYGAVSEPVASAMAQGARTVADAALAAAITGIAGPDGGTEQKPVGTVHIAVARRDLAMLHQRFLFTGARDVIRLKAVEAALQMLHEGMQ